MKKDVLLFLVVLLFGCKKDPLEGDTKILEGKWRWIYSEREKENVLSGNIISVDTIFANSSEDVHEIEFLSKGKIHFLENNTIVEKFRIALISFSTENCVLGSDCSRTLIALNNDENNGFGCWVRMGRMVPSKTTLPFSSDTVSEVITRYTNFYQKVN